jgi:hypothetical protein
VPEGAVSIINQLQAAAAPRGTEQPPVAPPHLPAERQALVTEHGFLAASLASALAVNALTPIGYKTYLDDLLKQAGATDDPIEKMLIEQVALAHLYSAHLHAMAGDAKTIDLTSAYCAMGGRLLTETRKTALALAAYRESRLRLQRIGRHGAGKACKARQRADA